MDPSNESVRTLNPMNLSKNQISDEVILRFKDAEFDIVCAALRAAANNISKASHEYSLFYAQDRADVVALWNAIEQANNET